MAHDQRKHQIIAARRRRRWALIRVLILCVGIALVVRASMDDETWTALVSGILSFAVWIGLNVAHGVKWHRDVAAQRDDRDAPSV